MRAVVHDEYGPPDVLRRVELPKPAPGDDEVLVRVHAVSLNPLDWHNMRADPFFIRLGTGLLKPKNRILGADLSGRVEAVGKNVKELRPGDDVFGTSKSGALVEYVCVTEDRLLPKPPGTTYEEAASVPVAALSALQGLRDAGKIQRGQKVLINGASGGVGTFAVQIAKAFETEVTGVCSTRNLDMVRSIGADHVVDYTREDVTQKGQHYDLILDTAAFRSILDYQRVLSPGGNYVMIGGAALRIVQVLFLSLTGKNMRFMVAKMKREDLLFLKELLDSGKVVPVIDRRYPLSEAADALRYLEEGHARGKVIVTV